MIKFVIVCVFFVLGFAIAQNNVLHGHVHEHVKRNCSLVPNVECDLDAHHIHCHWPDDDTIHLCLGETISLPHKCLEMTCVHPDGDVLMVRGCHNITPKPGCRLTEQDNEKLFPECCPQEIC